MAPHRQKMPRAGRDSDAQIQATNRRAVYFSGRRFPWCRRYMALDKSPVQTGPSNCPFAGTRAVPGLTALSLLLPREASSPPSDDSPARGPPRPSGSLLPPPTFPVLQGISGLVWSPRSLLSHC